MLSFELSAIDLILAISVIVLLILQLSKSSTNVFDQLFSKISKKSHTSLKKPSLKNHSNYATCPRGFGNIKKLSEDNSVSDKCLGCYQIMECYSEKEQA